MTATDGGAIYVLCLTVTGLFYFDTGVGPIKIILDVE
jgi:hypothetical protein